MKEHPILFNDEMVRAILEGRKIQTRRPIVPQPKWGNRPSLCDDGTWALLSEIGWGGDFACNEIGRCPYGVPGDHLWVRETFLCAGHGEHGQFVWAYRADCRDAQQAGDQARPFRRYDTCKWRCSIHMFRCASRILLENTDVRMQRLRKITCAEVEAEGVRYNPMEQLSYRDDCYQRLQDFAWTWDSIYAKPKPVYRNKQIVHYVSYPWEAGTETREHRGLPWFVYGNPWVWATSFKRLKPEEVE